MKKKGFTLIELLAVIAILGLVATLASVSVMNIIDKQKDELLKEQIANLRDSAQSYYVSSKRYLTVCQFYSSNEEDRVEELKAMLRNPNLSCGMRVQVKDLVESGFFENKNDVCDENEYLLIFRASQNDTNVYVPDGVCSK